MAKFVYINKRDTCPKLSKYPNNQKTYIGYSGYCGYTGYIF